MARELKSETLDPLSGPERLMLFCVASRMDPAIAGLPHRTAELLVMKNLALRDRARLSLTDQGQAALYSVGRRWTRKPRQWGHESPRPPRHATLTRAGEPHKTASDRPYITRPPSPCARWPRLRSGRSVAGSQAPSWSIQPLMAASRMVRSVCSRVSFAPIRKACG
jgi:hypothetical protein